MGKNMKKPLNLPITERMDMLKRKVSRTQAKVSMLRGTGGVILASLKKLQRNIEEAHAEGKFPPVCPSGGECSAIDLFISAR